MANADSPQRSRPQAQPENTMADDGEWVQDVKRWYLASVQASARSPQGAPTEYDVDLGYEAAHPALQACHWPDASALTTDR